MKTFSIGDNSWKKAKVVERLDDIISHSTMLRTLMEQYTRPIEYIIYEEDTYKI